MGKVIFKTIAATTKTKHISGIIHFCKAKRVRLSFALSTHLILILYK